MKALRDYIMHVDNITVQYAMKLHCVQTLVNGMMYIIKNYLYPNSSYYTVLTHKKPLKHSSYQYS